MSATVILGALALATISKSKTTAMRAIGYRNGQAFSVNLVAVGGGFVLAEVAAQAYIRMRAEAARQGVDLILNSAFRSNVEQDKLYALYKNGKGNLAAPPGYSNHQAGTAVDIESDGGKNATFKWLTANAATFGFKRTVASEPWHWEFI